MKKNWHCAGSVGNAEKDRNNDGQNAGIEEGIGRTFSFFSSSFAPLAIGAMDLFPAEESKISFRPGPAHQSDQQIQKTNKCQTVDKA